MSEAIRSPRPADSLQVSDIVGYANKQLAIERACLLIDNYVETTTRQEADAALAKIKAAMRAREPDSHSR
jgi:hypothetical protein